MPVIKGQEWTFNTVAKTYEKIRPGYPKELYQAVFAYAPLDTSSSVVEVGIGGGQATPPVLETGCKVTAVEYGDQLAQLCREKFKDYPGFSAITGKFEDVDLPDDTYDLIYSASAFHWVPEEIGYTKVFRKLKPGGAFARFANHPYIAKDDPELFDEIQRAYADYYYPFYKKEPKKISEYTEQEAADRAMIAEKYGFTDTKYMLFHRTRILTAAEYRALISTYSDHIVLEESIREPFQGAIEAAIERHGGKISIFDTLDLQLARKPKK
ncbi:MAG: methyltransferase domain-containing protein [Lachnospiraceae bacterium]|nr:methyltransferase domain-containing protein [Lachnospiraceae bacterium]